MKTKSENKSYFRNNTHLVSNIFKLSSSRHIFGKRRLYSGDIGTYLCRLLCSQRLASGGDK